MRIANSYRFWLAVMLMASQIGKLSSAASPPVRLIEAGEPRAAIVLSDHPELSARYAATVLNRYLKASTGVELPILHQRQLESGLPTADRNWVLLGDSEISRELGLGSEDQPYGGFTITSRPATAERGGILAIVGRDFPDLPEVDGRADAASRELIQHSDSQQLGWRVQRINLEGDYVEHYWNSGGTLYGVYRFLHDEIGIRWLWPGKIGTVIPAHETVEVMAGQSSAQPALLIRWIRNNSPGTLQTAYEEAEWWRANYQGKQRRFRANHAFNHWRDNFFSDYPQYFGWQPLGRTHAQPLIAGHHWKICPSDQGVVERILADGQRLFQNDPHAWTLSVSQGDIAATGNCFCEQCLEFDHQLIAETGEKATRSYKDGKTGETFEHIQITDRHVAWWNRMAEQLAETNPDRYLASWAYGPYSPPPLREQPRDNVIVGVVSFNWTTPGEADRQAWDGWAEKAKNLLLRPNALHAGMAFPLNYARVMAEDLRKNHESGMIGAEFDSLTSHWATQGLIYYVLAQVMWNPQLDVDSLIDDYCQAAFGPAAAELRQYFDLLEEMTDRFRQSAAQAPADYLERLPEELDQTDRGRRSATAPGEINQISSPINLEAAPAWIAGRVGPRERYRQYSRIFLEYHQALAGTLLRAQAATVGEHGEEYRQRIAFIQKGLLYAFLEADVLAHWYELPRHELFERIERRDYFLEQIQDTHVVNAQRLRSRHGRYAINQLHYELELPYWHPRLLELHGIEVEELGFRPDLPRQQTTTATESADRENQEVVWQIRLPREKWRFRTEPEREGYKLGWYRPEFDDSTWETIDIEQSWTRVEGYHNYIGSAWYRRNFELPAAPDHELAASSFNTVEIAFEGVDEMAWVWVNGQFVGAHYERGPMGWDTPFSLTITEVVEWGKSNQISVLAMNTTRAGGIWRPIRIRALNSP